MTDDCGVATEAPLPEQFTDESRRLGIAALIVRSQKASVRGDDAEFGEVVGGAEGDLDLLRRGAGRGFAEDRLIAFGDADDAAERLGIGGVEGEFGIGQIGDEHTGRTAPQVDQRIGVGERPSLKIGKSGTKNGEGHANSRCQHEHGGDGEAGGVAEHAGAVREVLSQAVEPGPAPDFASVFAQAQVAAEFGATLR